MRKEMDLMGSALLLLYFVLLKVFLYYATIPIDYPYDYIIVVLVNTIFYYILHKKYDIAAYTSSPFNYKIYFASLMVMFMVCGFKIITIYGYKILFLGFEKFATDFNDKRGPYEYLFIANVTVPVIEELFFRKILLGSLIKKYSSLAMLVYSSLIFAACHIFNQDASIATFILHFISGFILGSFYVRYKDIYLCIFMHFSFNLMVHIYFIVLFIFDIYIYTGNDYMIFTGVNVFFELLFMLVLHRITPLSGVFRNVLVIFK